MIGLGALVAYKEQPAVVLEISSKITIRVANGAERRVREKDIEQLHPGPVSDISHVVAPVGEIETAWEMLEGNEVSLREFCELAFEEFTPGSAWAAWQVLTAGELFRADDTKFRALPRLEVDRLRAERRKKQEAEEGRVRLVERIRSGAVTAADRASFGEIEAVARGASANSKIMRDLGIQPQPERAHDLLLRHGVWDPIDNPYPARFGVATRTPLTGAIEDDTTERRDLTHAEAFAIDDIGTSAADDAVGRDGDDFWVHIADPAAGVSPGSAVSLGAYERAATLHNPEHFSHMLPENVIRRYSLGGDESRALSFRFNFELTGEPILREIVPSFVSVLRMTYEEADARLKDKNVMRSIEEMTRIFAGWRQTYAAPAIQLPEARIRVEQKRISIEPIEFGRSRDLVLESMLMVGYGVGRYAETQRLPIPYARQEEPELDEIPETLSAMWSARRRYKRSDHSTIPGPHAGLGLPVYVQATSPLRRYLDLLVHQQLRAALIGIPPLDTARVVELIGGAEARFSEVRKVESLSDRHYTLAYLLQNSDWTGTGVVVATGKNVTVMVPELGLEAELAGRNSYELDDEVRLQIDTVRLPTLQCYMTEV